MFVYIIEYPKAAAVKIGYSASDPAHRLKQLQCGCPHELRLAFHWKLHNSNHARQLEVIAHRELSDRRMLGEWFSCSTAEAIKKIGQIITDQGYVPREVNGAKRAVRRVSDEVGEIRALVAAGFSLTDAARRVRSIVGYGGRPREAIEAEAVEC